MKSVISIAEVKELVHDDKLYFEKIRSLKENISDDVRNISKLTNLFENSKTQMTNGNMYTMLTLMKMYNSFKDIPITKEDFLDDYSNTNNYSDFFDNAIEKFHATYEDSHNKVMKVMEDITYSINEPSIFSAKNVLLRTSPTVSIKDIMDIGERNPEFKEIMDFTHEERTAHLENMRDKIKMQDDNNIRSAEIIKQDNKNQFKRLLESGGGINIDQLGEVFNVVGYKPDIRGRVVPRPVDRSFFKGLTSIHDFYTDALGARKALNASKMQVRQSGYLNRKISILTEDVRIDPNMEDCQTAHFLPYKINSEKEFELIIGRYYRLEDKDLMIKAEDTYLIGATVFLRSPLTCAHEGENICIKCYGQLAKVNMGLNVGTIANLIFTEPMTQKLLSMKHTLTVDVDFSWDEEFLKYFIVDGNIIIPKDLDLEVHVEKKNLIINKGYTTNRFRTKEFYVMDGDEKVYLHSPLNLLIRDNDIDDIEEFYDDVDEVYKFSLQDLNNMDYMFTVVIRNVGVADPLLEMKAGMDKNYKMNVTHSQDIFTYYQDLIELLIKSNTYVMSIHIEVIVSCMLKYNDRSVLCDPYTNLLEIDTEISTEEQTYRKYYRLYNINDAIYHSDSIVKSLMYQQTVKQLETDSFNNPFGKRASSEFDRMFISKSKR